MNRISKILVAVDLSPSARHALLTAIGLARQLSAQIEVLHVWTSPAYATVHVGEQVSPDAPVHTLDEISRQEASTALTAFLSEGGDPALSGLTFKIGYGPPADVIVAAAQGYDLVVMGTHGRSGVAHLILGSVAEHVVRRCPKPVMTVRLAS